MGPNGQAQYFARDIGEACQILLPALRAHLRGARRALPAPGGDHRPVGPRRAAPPLRAPRGRHGFATVGDVLLRRRSNPGRKKPFDIRTRDAGGRRPGPPAPRALVRHARRRDGGGLGRAPRRLPGVPARHRVAAAAAPRLPPGDGPEQWTGGHALPAVLQEGRPGHQRGERQPAGGGAGQPLRLRRLAGVDAPAGSSSTAPRSAARSSTSADRSSSASISRYHGGAFVVFSERPQRQPGGRRRSRAPTPRSSAAPRRPRWSSRARWSKRARRTRGSRSCEARVAAASGHEKARLRARLREVLRAVHSEKLGRGGGRVRRASTAWSGPGGVGSVHEIIPRAPLRPHPRSRRIERGHSQEREAGRRSGRADAPSPMRPDRLRSAGAGESLRLARGSTDAMETLSGALRVSLRRSRREE